MGLWERTWLQCEADGSSAIITGKVITQIRGNGSVLSPSGFNAQYWEFPIMDPVLTNEESLSTPPWL